MFSFQKQNTGAETQIRIVKNKLLEKKTKIKQIDGNFR